jgi:hypothetical protein
VDVWKCFVLRGKILPYLSMFPLLSMRTLWNSLLVLNCEANRRVSVGVPAAVAVEILNPNPKES